MGKRYLVTAPYVTFVTNSHDGPKLLGFYAGAEVPADASEESIEHHLRLELIAPVEDAKAPAEAKPAPAKSTPAK